MVFLILFEILYFWVEFCLIIVMIFSNLLVGLLLLVTFAEAQDGKLIYVQQVFRHGARYPIYPNNVDGSNIAWMDRAPGELTSQGKSMHYLLGRVLYENYWNRLFGSSKAYNQTKFYFKSTDVNRTIESLQSQLLGIFENTQVLMITGNDVNHSLPAWNRTINRQSGNVYDKSPYFHSLPVHVQKAEMTPWTGGDFLRTYSTDFCYKQKSWMQTNKRDSYVKTIITNTNFTNAVKQLSKVMGKDLNFFDVYQLYDNAECLTYMSKKPLDIFTGTTGVARDLRAISTLDGYIKMFYTYDQQSTTSTGYFNETVNNFKRVIASQDGVQWAFYSAHDTTVMNFISKLGLTSAQCIYENYLNGTDLNSQSQYCIVEYPTYTSSLIFQVYQYQNKTNTFKIRYNGFERRIPFCGWAKECPVQNLYKWFEGWKVDDYVKVCGIVDKTAENYFSVIMIELAIIIVFAVASVLRYINKKDQKQAQAVAKHEAPHKEGRPQVKDSLLSEEDPERE